MQLRNMLVPKSASWPWSTGAVRLGGAVEVTPGRDREKLREAMVVTSGRERLRLW